jgi:hypothetical protein
MTASKFRLAAACLLVANLLFSSWPTAAAGPVTFTMVAASTYLYSGPSKNTARVFSIFKGEVHNALGRTADSSWLLLDFPFSAWVQTNVGTTSAEVSTLPVKQGNTTPGSGSSNTGNAPSGGGGSTGVILAPTNMKLTISVSSYIRSGPARSNNSILSASIGQVYVVRGRTQDQAWLQIVLPGDPTEAWITSGAGKLSGDILKLPVVAAGSASVVANNPKPPVSQPLVIGNVSPTPGGFELGGQVGGFDYPDKMHYAGMTWVKRQVRWNPGANADAGVIADAHGKGFKVLLSVLGDPGSIVGGANYDDYARFVGDLAASGADAIEVWNEMNIDREWPTGGISPASYVELLRRAYTSIKSRNGGTLVISGAPAPTGFFGGCSPTGCDDKPYIEGLVAAGGLNYLDCLGMHYNEGVVSPLQSSGDPRGNPNYYSRYYQTMVDTYWNAEGGRKKLCFTELGYLSGEEWGSLPSGFTWRPPYNLTVAEHAQYLAQAAQLSRDQGKVRLMIIFNVDLRTFGADPQAGYAIVRPNGGCPACDALRAVLGGA